IATTQTRTSVRMRRRSAPVASTRIATGSSTATTPGATRARPARRARRSGPRARRAGSAARSAVAGSRTGRPASKTLLRCRRRPSRRQAQRDGRPSRGVALDPDGATMLQDDLATQGEAETTARGAAGAAVEAIEDEGQIRLGDAGTLVAQRHHGVVAVRTHREPYRRRRRRVTERVVDQIEQHALQEERLSTDGHGRGRGALESPSLLLRNRFE